MRFQTAADGKRHSTFAPTLDKLREIEEELAADKHDGIKTDVKGLTVNDCYELWKELKRGIKDSTYKNYIYMYEMFVKPTFGQKKVTKVLKSDVKRFYNTLADDKHLKVSTIDNIHMQIKLVSHEGALEINQLSATSRLLVPAGYRFRSAKKGIATSIYYEKMGKKVDDFSDTEADNYIELNGMKSELVIVEAEM